MLTVIIYIRKFLLEPIQPLWRYCLIALPITLLPTVILFVIACGILSFIGVNVNALLLQKTPIVKETSVIVLAFGSVVIAPIVETFLLAGLLKILSKVNPRPFFIAAYAAVVWGGLHGLFGILGFFGSVWNFFVFSCSFIAWRKLSFKQAFIAAAVPHAFVNLIAILVFVLSPHV